MSVALSAPPELFQLTATGIGCPSSRRWIEVPMQAFGYLQVAADSPDEAVQQIEQSLREFATRRRLCLTTFFFEYSTGSHQAFDTMVTELQQQRARHVVVPSMEHLANNTLLQNMMLNRLEHAADAEVLAVSEETAS
ncbi:hypothetical protein ACPZ19_18895 [Amycolatopsis lurida]